MRSASRLVGLVSLLTLVLLPAPAVRAQCILANPSFELDGSVSAEFSGWYEFGNVGTVSTAAHGFQAARVTGPNTGDWGVSGFWQQLAASPGQQWRASAYVQHPSSKPLNGASSAILNIEWRDAGLNLISYESLPAATSGTPTDTYQLVSLTSAPAPVGTAYTRVLVANVQGPGDAAADAYFDAVQFEHLGPPTPEQRQWNDFPGGTTLSFSGRTWRVKGPGYYGPGTNLFCDSGSCVWVDGSDRLHMTIKNISGSWYSTEVTLEEALGYGDYVFTTVGNLGLLDPKAVLGLFLWRYGPCYDSSYLWWNPYDEIDVEISRWANPSNDLGQFVAQPYDFPGNINRFSIDYSGGGEVSYAFRWLPDGVAFRSWFGGALDEIPENLIHTWDYTGPHIPRPEEPRVHINLWQFTGPPATNQEVVLSSFRFVPEESVTVSVEPPATGTGRQLLAAPVPNPFRSSTVIRWTLPTEGPTLLAVFDVSGRRVRTLVDEVLPAGAHSASWNGTSQAGSELPPGVYQVLLRTPEREEARSVVRLR